VESPLSVRLLRGDFRSGDRVLVDVGEEGLVFQRMEPLEADHALGVSESSIQSK